MIASVTPNFPGLVECELWLRTPNPGAGAGVSLPDAPREPAFVFDRIWFPDPPGDTAGLGYLVTRLPPLLHDHLELPLHTVMSSGAEVPGQSLIVVGRSWRHYRTTGRVLQIALAQGGRLIHHTDPGTTEQGITDNGHLCITAH